MDKILISLHKNTNAALEAQTGFGKSVCLFAATSSFQIQFNLAKELLAVLITIQQSPNFKNDPHKNHIKLISQQIQIPVNDLNLSFEFIKTNQKLKKCLQYDKVTKIYEALCPQIIFLSRTHTQLQQANACIKLLKLEQHISYLGSRSNFCLNEQAKHLSVKDKIPIATVCKSLLKNRKCTFSVQTKLEITDLEDILSSGTANKVCPYFASRQSLDSQIIIAPYNYIFDQELLKVIQNPIIIFDEGHNFESFVKTQFQAAFTSDNIGGALKNIALALEVCRELELNQTSLQQQLQPTKPLNESQKYYQNHYQNLKKLGDILLTIKLNIEALSNLETLYFENIYDKVNLKSLTMDLIESANYADFVIYNLRHDYRKSNSKSQYLYLQGDRAVGKNYQFGLVIQVAKIVEIAYNATVSGAKSEDIGVVFQKDKFHIFCLNSCIPAYLIQQINPFSVILTSATLSPMRDLEMETGLNYTIKESFQSVMKKHQVICKNIDDSGLIGTFQNRNNYYFSKVIQVIKVSQFNTLHGGILVFVQSYQIIKEIKKLLNGQYIYFEGDHDALNSYSNNLSQRPILVAVARGTLSEGIDFADELCRTVIIVSIPFPDIKDQILIQQRDWLDKYGKGLTGSIYYENLAFRAVNQCIGRVIRNKNDFGTVILADQRYCEQRNINKLPKWIVQNVQTYKINNLGEYNNKKQNIVKTEDSDVIDVPVTISQVFTQKEIKTQKQISLNNINMLKQNNNLSIQFLQVITKLKKINIYEQLKKISKEAKLSIVQASISLTSFINENINILDILDFEVILANIDELLLLEVLTRL
ncbi:DNA repair helicase [Spironucleus salmonicida]|nr:DNA repair helicase [Spironucleus salmonicida]